MKILQRKKTQTKNIVFVNALSVSEEYKPKPASTFIPDWYKEMASYVPENKNHPKNDSTIKRCPPVFDAITAGYIIVTPCDVHVTFKDGSPVYDAKLKGIITTHSVMQAYAHPKMNEYSFPKWMNPWSIETPKGYSIIVKNPAHNPNPWFEILEGIVDTDKYNETVNFPFILKNPKLDCVIPANTPIAQIIPFKRDKWSHSFSQDIKKRLEHNSFIHSVYVNAYRNKFWQRKEFK